MANVHDLPLVFAGTAKANLYPSGGVDLIYTPAVSAADTLKDIDSTSVFIKLLPFNSVSSLDKSLFFTVTRTQFFNRWE